MKEIKHQSLDKAIKMEMGCLRDVRGNLYTPSTYPFVLVDKPYYGLKFVYKWRTEDGQKIKEFDHEETDYSRYESDDGQLIESGMCRSCKEKIEDYPETFFKKIFEYNHWTNIKINKASGYCRQCALNKAVIEDYGWNPALSILERTIKVDDGNHLEVRKMEDGSILEETLENK